MNSYEICDLLLRAAELIIDIIMRLLRRRKKGKQIKK